MSTQQSVRRCGMQLRSAAATPSRARAVWRRLRCRGGWEAAVQRCRSRVRRRQHRSSSSSAPAARQRGTWTRHFDERSQRWYYHDTVTGRTQWELPPSWAGRVPTADAESTAAAADALGDEEADNGAEGDGEGHAEGYAEGDGEGAADGDAGEGAPDGDEEGEQGEGGGAPQGEGGGGGDILRLERLASPNRGLLNRLYRKHTQHGDSTLIRHLEGSALADANAALARRQRSIAAAPELAHLRAERKQLPIYAHRDEIINTVRNSPVVVLRGETGCGKTTQVPQYLLEALTAEGRGGEGSIICTQPRRVSAVAVATRVAQERGEEPGATVGYAVRGDSKRTRDTRVLFCTTGVLLRTVASSPDLPGVSHVIVDEVHERGMLTDFLLILLRGMVEGTDGGAGFAEGRPPPLPPGWREATDKRTGNLYYYHREHGVQWQRPRPRAACPKIILMSATLDTGLLSEYFGGSPIITVPGRLYPVEALHLEEIVRRTGYCLPFGSGRGWAPEHIEPGTPPAIAATCQEVPMDEIDYPLVGYVIEHIHTREPPGAILVFLTGAQEIQRVADMIAANENCMGCYALQLHGSMPPEQQVRVFQPAPAGKRKVVLATNVAETSITVQDVVYVVDCGRVKERRWTPGKSLASLKEVTISMANARQRQGRAGRVRSGRVYRLWPTRAGLAEYQTPEMVRSPLEELVLQSALLGMTHPAEFLQRAVDPPRGEDIAAATTSLQTLGAVMRSPDSSVVMTPLGFHLATLPADPRLGKMLLLAATFGLEEPMLTIAATIGSRPIFASGSGEVHKAAFGDERSDQLAVARAFRLWREKAGKPDEDKWVEKHGLTVRAMRELGAVRRQLQLHLKAAGWLEHQPGASGRDFSGHGAEWHETELELLRGIIAAGLYPNLARGERAQWKRKVYERCTVGHWEEVKMHPSSVNSNITGVPNDHTSLYVFVEKVETTQVFLRDSTLLNPATLLLFGPQTLPTPEEVAEKGHVDLLPNYRFEVVDYEQFYQLKADLERVLMLRCMRPSVACGAAERDVLLSVRDFLNDPEPRATLLPPDPIPAATGIGENWVMPPWLRRNDEDLPGEYVITHDGCTVTQTAALGSTPVATLNEGQLVWAEEILRCEEDERVRARIAAPSGWISLLGLDDGYRWARRQEAAE